MVIGLNDALDKTIRGLEIAVVLAPEEEQTNIELMIEKLKDFKQVITNTLVQS